MMKKLAVLVISILVFIGLFNGLDYVYSAFEHCSYQFTVGTDLLSPVLMATLFAFIDPLDFNIEENK